MKFLIDAQLPVRLARFLQTAGYDVIHTKDLPEQNSTSVNEGRGQEAEGRRPFL